MSVHYLLKTEHENIITSARLGILYGMLEAWRRQPDGPEEPDIIASLVLNTVPLWGNALSVIFNHFNFHISIFSAFCHQTPKVNFPMTGHQSCELGDILFVYIHKGQDITVRNALLYQAKISKEQPYSIRPNDRHQLDLYMKWPKFKYIRSGTLSGRIRDIKPKGPHTGAQYMLIDNRPPNDPHSGLLGFTGTYPIGSCMPDDKLADHSDLASELFHFLTLRSGRQFYSKDEAKHDGWSQVIWDLLTTSFSKAFTRRKAGYVDISRIQGIATDQLDGLSFSNTLQDSSYSTVSDAIGRSAADFIFQSGRGDNYYGEDRKIVKEDRSRGISVVLLESSEKSEERMVER